MRHTVAIVAVLLGMLCSLACLAFQRDDLYIETRSPKGTYTLLFEGETSKTPTIAGVSEMVKLTVVKGQATYFVKDPFFGEKGLGSHFRDVYPQLEWLNDSAIRLGKDVSSEPYLDRITVLNSTKETLSVVEIFYGRSERFLILDFEPGAELVLSPSPQFGVHSSPARTVTYRALNLANRERQGMIEGQQRKHPSEGPLNLAVIIKQ
jgi:hypothetical protein